jgi:hypothetical protein
MSDWESQELERERRIRRVKMDLFWYRHGHEIECIGAFVGLLMLCVAAVMFMAAY